MGTIRIDGNGKPARILPRTDASSPGRPESLSGEPITKTSRRHPARQKAGANNQGESHGRRCSVAARSANPWVHGRRSRAISAWVHSCRMVGVPHLHPTPKPDEGAQRLRNASLGKAIRAHRPMPDMVKAGILPASVAGRAIIEADTRGMTSTLRAFFHDRE